MAANFAHRFLGEICSAGLVRGKLNQETVNRRKLRQPILGGGPNVFVRGPKVGSSSTRFSLAYGFFSFLQEVKGIRRISFPYLERRRSLLAD